MRHTRRVFVCVLTSWPDSRALGQERFGGVTPLLQGVASELDDWLAATHLELLELLE